MNLLACIHTHGVERLILLLLLVVASIGCTTPMAQVESVVKGNRLAAGAELQGVQVTRGNASLTTATGMPLQKGDRIVTDGTTEAVILFGDAYEVILGSDTDISISPDIFVNFGKAVVKKLREIREKFRVETKYVNAGVEHTEFAISVDRGDVVSVVVFEGTVTLESTTKNWAPQTIGPREAAVVRSGQLPSRRASLPQSELDRTFGWARPVEAIALPAEVPDLNGLLLDEARQKLSGAGLQLGRIEKVAAAGRRLDTVVGQSRPAGQRLRLGTPVDLRVTGESTVPDVRGMSRLEAGIALALAGLKVGETSEEEVTGARPGKVARQSPSPGTRIPPGTPVSLVIARAVREPTKPDTVKPDAVGPNKIRPKVTRPTVCTVPDILRGGQQNARQILKDAGLELGRELKRIEGPPYQDPKAGAHVVCGSSVDVAW